MTEMATGTVKFFNTTRGFGFIAPDDGSKDIFVHISAVQQSEIEYLVEGQKVSFDVEEEARGPKAVNLREA
jgi:CspA family cold shock protein